MAAGDRHFTKTQRNLGSACLVWGDVGRICFNYEHFCSGG
jgi:hypothetical protein